MTWILENLGVIALVALGISEALALLPGLQSNSILTLVINVLSSLVKKK